MLRNLIEQKARADCPLRPTQEQIKLIRTPVDEFPYQGFFRGRVDCAPTIFDRTAGWSPQYVSGECAVDNYYPNHCFQYPCNTVLTLEKKGGKCVVNPCITLYR
jgi:hypothetical protein